MLPNDIILLILEFHDEFDIASKKKRLHHVIRNAYTHWALDYGVNSNFMLTEYEAKSCLYPYIGTHCFVTDPVNWVLYINYFRYYDKAIK